MQLFVYASYSHAVLKVMLYSPSTLNTSIYNAFQYHHRRKGVLKAVATEAYKSETKDNGY